MIPDWSAIEIETKPNKTKQKVYPKIYLVSLLFCFKKDME